MISLSKRSTIKTRLSLKVAISTFAVGRPRAAVSVRQRYSFSTEFERSMPFGGCPICGLKMWVVGVEPVGRNH